MLTLFSFIFGLIIGSFANVFVLRYGTGRSLNGRSSCAVCGKKLSWYELIPVVSYLIQRGRCSGCESKISIQYPLVELVFGIVFALCAYTTHNLQPTTFAHPHNYILLLYLWAVSFLLLSIAIYDIRHMIIPNGMVYALAGITILFRMGELLLAGSTSLHPYILVLIAGPLVALPLFALWFFSRGKWMGFGDVKFALVMGWMLGIVGGLSAFVFAVWAGALVGLAVIGISRLVSQRSGLTMKSMIPFGPFLVVGTLFVLDRKSVV